MNNKYNVDFYKTMEIANNYLDEIEDSIDEIRIDDEMIYNLEDKLYMQLEKGNYQSVCDQLIVIEMTYILMRDVIPEKDMEFLTGYLEELSEAKLLNEVTRVIDKYYENGGNVI